MMPNVWSSTGPSWISGCTAADYPRCRRKLQIAHGSNGRPVDAHLEVEVVPEPVAGPPLRPDHLARLRPGAGTDADRRLVRVAGGHAAAVLDARVLAVAAHPPRHRDRAARRRADR